MAVQLGGVAGRSFLTSRKGVKGTLRTGVLRSARAATRRGASRSRSMEADACSDICCPTSIFPASGPAVARRMHDLDAPLTSNAREEHAMPANVAQKLIASHLI